MLGTTKMSFVHWYEDDVMFIELRGNDFWMEFIKKYGAVKSEEHVGNIWMIEDHEQAVMMLAKYDEYLYD